MARKKFGKAANLTSPFVYQTKNQTIYYDWITKKGHVLTDSVMKKYAFYESKIPLSLGLGAIAYLYFQNGYAFFIAAIAIYVGFSIPFRLLFLNKLPTIENFQRPKKENILISFARRFSYTRCLVIIILCVFLTYFCVLNLKVRELSTISTIGYILMTAASIVIAILALTVQVIKHEKKL